MMDRLYSSEPALQTPVYVVDELALRRNLEILSGVQRRTGCHILLAQKAFSLFYAYPLIGRYLAGTTASGLFEARLAHEEMPGRENHVYSPLTHPPRWPNSWRSATISASIASRSSKPTARCGRAAAQRGPARQPGTLHTGRACDLRPLRARQPPWHPPLRYARAAAKRVEGLHFHTLCEQDAAPLVETFAAFEQAFGEYLPQLRWLNLGGGHHITRPGYDLAALEGLILSIREKYGLEVYLEPGEAIALNAGTLITTVLDIVPGETPVLILDASAACHMPDVLEMPYRPPLHGAGCPGKAVYLPPGRPHLPGGGCDRGLQL